VETTHTWYCLFEGYQYTQLTTALSNLLMAN